MIDVILVFWHTDHLEHSHILVVVVSGICILIIMHTQTELAKGANAKCINVDKRCQIT